MHHVIFYVRLQYKSLTADCIVAGWHAAGLVMFHGAASAAPSANYHTDNNNTSGEFATLVRPYTLATDTWIIIVQYYHSSSKFSHFSAPPTDCWATVPDLLLGSGPRHPLTTSLPVNRNGIFFTENNLGYILEHGQVYSVQPYGCSGWNETYSYKTYLA